MSDTAERPEGRSETMAEPEGMKWLSGIASLVGLWILVSPFVYAATDAGLWNNVIIGAAIFLIAGYNYYRIVNDYPTSVGAMSLVALLALWTIAAPFTFEIGVDALLWSNVVAGLLGLIFAGYVAYTGRRIRAGAPAGATD
ncbi:SPW repeat domain-containing protein [Natrialbaceae archaeon AArc-T1-2]|uniref:SPW repeat domain-containing protein n=1 Tax=Natrialbaceae archaeon AArc-T1-2 TaxID=3053904 RepID=UPI00255AC80F|nr:SPW repeat protein [Natrialbaceae archaeon AArc-T1-2]WIV66531.1 SPW repeat protein [Natrialbaceae archaeon AArc-T1-2]